jgi:hypothetical protein
MLFFVGRSPKVGSEAEGLRMASKDAREQLLRQEFGTTVKVNTTQTETLKDVSLESQLSEISDLILLKGFKQSDVYAEKDGEDTLVWALFSVPKSEIKAEKIRVAKLQKRKSKFSETEPVKVTEIASKEFDNGGKPKLRKGMNKTQVIAIFGPPKEADKDSYFGTRFLYDRDHSDFCNSNLCFVHFDTRGRVESWNSFKPELTSDLDDEVALGKSSIKRNRSSVVSTARSQNGEALDGSTALNENENLLHADHEDVSLLKPSGSSHGGVEGQDFGSLVDDKDQFKEGAILTDPVIISKWFFVKQSNDTNKNFAKIYSPMVVSNGQQFGFKFTYRSKKKNLNMRIQLEVPGSPENFPCSTCAPGELFISPDSKSVTIVKRIKGGEGRNGFYWGIDRKDPRGDYVLKFSINGILVEKYKFKVI